MKPTRAQVLKLSNLANQHKLLNPVMEEVTLKNGTTAKVNVAIKKFEEWLDSTYDIKSIGKVFTLMELIDKDLPGAVDQFNRVYKQ